MLYQGQNSKKMKLVKHSHRPAHLFIDNTAYFISAATYQHQKYLDAVCKDHHQSLLHQVFTQYQWQLAHWVILDNHYHLLCHSKKGTDLPKIMAKLHALSSQYIKAKANIEDIIWSNYWDYCPRNEREYNIRLCYLLDNPHKHGYVESLHDWKWSSFHQFFDKTGKKALKDLFLEHREYRDACFE